MNGINPKPQMEPSAVTREAFAAEISDIVKGLPPDRQLQLLRIAQEFAGIDDDREIWLDYGATRLGAQPYSTTL